MVGKLEDMKKASTVSRSSMANRRQVKVFVPERQPSKVGLKPSHSCAVSVPSKNHLAWYVALDSKPSEKKISQIRQIKWKCPPKFALSIEWRVAAGEGSQEAEAQTCREKHVPEIVYPHLSAIPPSPFCSVNTKGDHCGDDWIPIIPTFPIEEGAAAAKATTFETSEPIYTCNASQSPASAKLVPPVSANLPLPQYNLSDKSLPDMRFLQESGNLEVAAAAAATVAAVMESKEQIDTQLLIKVLTDPEMVKKLIDKNGLRLKPGDGTPPASEPNSFVPWPSLAPAAVVINLTNQCSEPLNRTIPSIARLSREGGINAGMTSVPRYHSDVAHSQIHQIAEVNQVRPLMPYTLRPNEETIRRLINKYGPPDVAGVTHMACLHPSTTKPNPEEIKKMINQYGASGATGVKPVAPVNPPTSTPPYMGEMKNMMNEFGIPNHGTGNAFSGPPNPLSSASSSAKPAMVISPRANPGAPELRFNATGMFQYPPFAPATTPALLVKQHGLKHETEFGEPGGRVQGLGLMHTSSTSIEMNPNCQKACLYFNSPRGCRNGSKCMYQHDISKQWRVGSVVEAPIAKRMKSSEWTRNV